MPPAGSHLLLMTGQVCVGGKGGNEGERRGRVMAAEQGGGEEESEVRG